MNTYNPDPVVSARLLRRTEAARYVADTYFPCSPKTLAKLACVSSNGPPFRKAGRIPLYPKSGLDAWARAKLVRWCAPRPISDLSTDANSERQTAPGTRGCRHADPSPRFRPR